MVTKRAVREVEIRFMENRLTLRQMDRFLKRVSREGVSDRPKRNPYKTVIPYIFTQDWPVQW